MIGKEVWATIQGVFSKLPILEFEVKNHIEPVNIFSAQDILSIERPVLWLKNSTENEATIEDITYMINVLDHDGKRLKVVDSNSIPRKPGSPLQTIPGKQSRNWDPLYYTLHEAHSETKNMLKMLGAQWLIEKTIEVVLQAKYSGLGGMVMRQTLTLYYNFKLAVDIKDPSLLTFSVVHENLVRENFSL